MKRHSILIFLVLGFLAALCLAPGPAAAGPHYDGYFTNVMVRNLFNLPERASAPPTPDTGQWYVYSYDDGVYVIDDAGNTTNLMATPIIIAQGATASTATGGGTDSCDVTGSTLSLADGAFAAGKTIKWTIAGTKDSTNGTMSVHLSLGGSDVLTLTSGDSAAADWIAEITMHEYTDTAHQKFFGTLSVNGKSVVTDYATGTTDMNSGSAVTAKIRIQAAGSGDNVVSEYVRVETLYN